MQGLEYALVLIAKKRYTQKEMEAKLTKKGFFTNPIIEKLKDLGYINDLEYAMDYLNKKQSEGYGKYKILFNLRNKGINDDILNKLEFSNEFLEDLFLKKIEKLKENKKQKIFLFLANRGFESNEINNLIYKYEDKL